MSRVPTATHWGNYLATVVDGRVTRLDPVPGDAEPSPIGGGMPAALRSASRITAPAVRRGFLEHGPAHGDNARGADTFVTVSWDEALDLAAGELRRVKAEHGNAAIYGGSYGWGSAGRFHHPQSQVHRFLGMHGGYTSSRNSYSFAAMEVILPHVIGGHGFSILATTPQWSEIEADGDLVVAFGGLALKNAQNNPGGVGRHAVADWQRRCREAGVEFVNVGPLGGDVDPRLGARWLALRPNTDVALMLGLAHTIIAEDRHDTAFLDACCVGFETLRRYIMGEADGVPKDAAWAAAITGVAAGEIAALAREIATRRTLITVSWSVQRADHGEQPYWMAVALAAISGSMGRPGGGFGAGYGAISAVGTSRSRHAVAAFPQPGNPVDAFIPVARITDLLTRPGETIDYDGQRLELPDIRLVYWCGGNPFHHHQDLNGLVRAWQRPETVIVHEHWWTATARHADIVFPVATSLERNDFAAGAQDPWLSVSAKAAEPPADVPTDFDVFGRLADRLGFGEAFTEGRTADEWVRELYDRTRVMLAEQGVEAPDFEAFWAAGELYLGEPEDGGRDPMQALRADPVAHPLATPSGRVELFSATIDGFGYEDCPGHPVWLEPAEWLGSPLAERFPLHLITNQPTTRLHSQYDHGSASVDTKVAGREPMTMHPDDARERGIADGDVVRLFNDRGACLVGVRLSTAVRPGVVQVATGAWYDPVEPGGLDRHGNPNVLTLDKGTSRLAQGPSALTVLVQAERFAGPAPAVRAFEAPDGLV